MNSSLIALIGNTPIVELTRFDTGKCKLFVKLESQNPAGSIKDRIALTMIEDAEKAGLIGPGSTLIEATAGNTGLGLALVSVLKGYKLILVIPDKMSREKIRHLNSLGAQIVMTRSDVSKGHPEYYQDKALAIAKATPKSWYANQFGNESNPKTHETTTGPEIFSQMDGQVDAIVCGVGSGGTLTGLSRYFAKASPSTEMILADPVGSILAHYIATSELLPEAGSWLVEGIGEDFIPPVADLSRVKKAYSITDHESLHTARELLTREGILAGSSSGTLVAAALKYCQEQTTPKNVVTFICDSGNKYLSKMFDDHWMIDQGMTDRTRFNDLRDVVSRRHADGTTITVSPNDNLFVAFSRMKVYDVSQLPVVDQDGLCGILGEEDLLMAITEDRSRFNLPVKDVMTSQVETLAPGDTLTQAIDMLKRGLVPVVTENKKFIGLITSVDVLNYLRRSQNV